MLLKETAGCLSINISRADDRNRFSGVHEIDCMAVSNVPANNAPRHAGAPLAPLIASAIVPLSFIFSIAPCPVTIGVIPQNQWKPLPLAGSALSLLVSGALAEEVQSVVIWFAP